MIIAVDVDGVVADLYDEWLRRYNRDYNDDMTVEKLTDWHITKLVKPECGNKIFDYLGQPDLYSCIEPIEGAKDGVRMLRNSGHRVVFVTSNIRGMTDQKWDWLVNHEFIEPGFYTNDMVVCHDKSLVSAHLLIDDGFHNVESWGDRAVLFGTYPHNQQQKGDFIRCANWDEVTSLICS